MPASIIQADYDQLQQIAGMCSSEASNMQDMYSNVLAKYDALRGGGWEGDAASKFFNEMESYVLPNMKKMVDAFQTTADQVQVVKAKFEEAEQQAAGKFKFGFGA
jgi:WXG100 family type VII secretion target